MRKFIAKNIGLPLFDALKKKSVSRHFEEFDKVIHSDSSSIKEYQLKKLAKLMNHAYENVPFYKKRFDKAGLTPGDINTVEDLKKIPPLTRDDLQNHHQDIIATNFEKSELSKGTSGGSTGVPVVYYKDRKGSSAGQAAGLNGWELAGWELGFKGLHIWGNPTTVENEWKSPLSRAKTKLYNHYKFAAYQLNSPEKFQELFNEINDGRYDFIDGYTNAIYMLSEHIRSNNLSLKKKLKFVFPTAENLQDYQRESIEKNLGPVFDSYGCSEINGIAYECRLCGKYHIIDPHVIVEFGKIVDEDGSHELIITDLDNYGFPLIRYQNDDAGQPVTDDAPECSIHLDRMQKITGRQSDILDLPGGGTLTVPSFFGSMLLKQVNGIKQYQIIRVEENLLHIYFVTSDKYAEKDESVVDGALKKYLGGKINYEIKYSDAIEVSKNGKFKLLIDKTKHHA